jgi:hypothetical protein
MGYASELGTFSVTIKKRFLSLVLPVLFCSLLSGLGSLIIFNFFGESASAGIGGGGVGGSALTALFYVGIAFIGATVIFLIFRSGKINLLKALFAFAIVLTSFFFVFLLILATPYYILETFWEATVFSRSTEIAILVIGIVLGLGYAALTVTSMVYQLTPKPIPQIMALLFAVLAGTFLATFLPALASVFVMIGLSIYDIISVFKGPIKKIAEISEQRNNQKTDEIDANNPSNSKEAVSDEEEVIVEVSSNDTENQNRMMEDEPLPDAEIYERNEYIYAEYIELGLGDLAFFGMLFSFALIRLGFLAAIAAFIGVVIGAILTIKLLEKVGMMPGLPLSIGLGLLFAFAVWGILGLAGYSSIGWNYPNWFGF